MNGKIKVEWPTGGEKKRLFIRMKKNTGKEKKKSKWPFGMGKKGHRKTGGP